MNRRAEMSTAKVCIQIGSTLATRAVSKVIDKGLDKLLK